MVIPRSVGSAAEEVIGARDDPARLISLFKASTIPMVLVDDSRRYVHINTAGLLAFRVGLTDALSKRIDDLTPLHLRPTLKLLWARLVETGTVIGRYEVASPDGSELPIVFYALAGALSGLYLIAFAPLGWSDHELAITHPPDTTTLSDLSSRELELVQLAAEGRTGPRIAEELALSPATVKKHFENVYAKLGVRDRAAAVAKAMRLGLIE
jgi:DNA-binding CsgD family transcriptional regulator